MCIRDSFNTGKVANDEIIRLIRTHFDLRPYGITDMLNLLQPMYEITASYGHFGRHGTDNAFTWERTDKVEAIMADTNW